MKNETLRERLHTIIFEADTKEGKLFDIILLFVIVLSVLTAILESVYVETRYYYIFYALEWVFTVLFLIEYLFRVYCVRRPVNYMLSFYGIIDLASCLPTILSLLLPGTQALIVVRAIRLLRIFRIFKLTMYFKESMVIYNALIAARTKILVFMFSIVIIVTLAGALMYVIEGAEHGFTNIPTSMYWAVVTLTTVGYGDLSPHTDLGRFMSSLLMILGYAIIAVPTGIITSELARTKNNPISNVACSGCGAQEHEIDASFCKKCGHKL